ncbi:MAG: DUF3299 domain-containing protein [Marinagarivorans sp.]|nr:DUF3299 domain-containing protein [Marinagarivorans sp.]
MRNPLNFVIVIVIVIVACLLLACEKREVTTTEDILKVAESPRVATELAKTKESKAVKETTYTEIDWVDLIPEDDLQALENPPAYLEDIEDGGIDDRLTSQLKTKPSSAEDRYQQALNSKQIRPEFNGRHIRIPGFIVPLEYNDQQTITTFFLVPFFGACLHMPPPPPNQIIYGEYEPGIRLDELYDPFWIEGTLSTTLVDNDMATAAYSINVATIEPYVEPTMAHAEEMPAP